MNETFTSRFSREIGDIREKIEKIYREDPLKTIAVGVSAVVATTKLIDAVGHYRSRVAYSKRMGRR